METRALRTHTFSWQDIGSERAAVRDYSARRYLEEMQQGEIPPPPFAAVLGLRLDAVADGRVVFSLEPQEFMQNGLGILHGGVAASMFDTAVGCACLTVLPAGKAAVTMDLNLRYFKPLSALSGRIRCEGQVINVGRTTITSEGRLFDGKDRLCGHATATLAIIDPPNPR
jgi:uncharacterized protein (TIGR00369 family)